MPRLGESLNAERKKDFRGLTEYFRSFRIADSFFEVANSNLLEEAHKLAFGVGIFISKLKDVPEYAEPYLSQLRSDAIQLISSVMIGKERGFKLLERSIIESLLRYIYYFHHEIEHNLLQMEPSRYKTFKELFEYVKRHPFFKDNSAVAHSIEILQSRYSELSRAVHTGTVFEMSLSNSITSINEPMSNLDEVLETLRTISQNVMFMLGCFHPQKYASLSLDEKRVVALLLTTHQKRILGRLT